MRPRLACAATVLLAAGFLVLVGCDSDDGSHAGESSSIPSNQLFAIWMLTSAAKSGKPIEIGPYSLVRWEFREDGPCGQDEPECPDGSKLMGNDGCNTFMRGVDDVQSETLTWGTEWYSTAVACSGGLADAMFNVFNADQVGYSVSANELHLTSADGTVEFTFQTADRRLANN
jgi:hypothetical protein